MAKPEDVKLQSQFLRGSIAAELHDEATKFSAPNAQLLKFHGMYQQEDRDARQERKREGRDKAHMFMVRSKIPGGRLTAKQYLVHDDIASRFANGTLRITARQGFQFHGVLKKDVQATLQSIHVSLLTTFGACGDVVRNVACCPCPMANEIERALCQQATGLSQHFLPRTRAYAEIWLDGEQVSSVASAEDEPLYGRTYLPRKFKIGIALPWDNCIDILAQDLGFVAVTEGDRIIGFNVYVGGGLGMTHHKPATFPALAQPMAWITPGELKTVATAVVETFRDWGDRENRKHARIKYLVAERGIGWMREEVERRLGYALEEPRVIALQDAHSHLGWQEQGDGRWALGVYVEGGRIVDSRTHRLKSAFREIVERFQLDVRLTADQNILFTNIPTDQRSDVAEILEQHGVIPVSAVAPVRQRAMACPALPTCGLALSEGERLLPSFLRELECELIALGLEQEGPVVRITGCPNGCARPYTAEVGIVGRSADLYVLYVGGSHTGTRLAVPVAEVHAPDLVPTLRPLLLAFRRDRETGERFGDFCHRIGEEQVCRLIMHKEAETDVAIMVLTDHQETTATQHATPA